MKRLALASASLLAGIAGLALPAAFPLAFPLAFPSVSHGAELVQTISIPVKVEGSVHVDFTSDPANGCTGPCDLSGSMTWDPTGEADLIVSEYRTADGRKLTASLFFLGGSDQEGPTTTAHVTRGAAANPDGVCSDARVATLTFLDFSADSSSFVEARLLRGLPDDPGLFRTRCGGPIERDLVAALPAVPLDRALLRKGGAGVDLSGTRPFAGDGFAGTARSSVQLHLGVPRIAGPSPRRAAPRRPPAYAPRTVIAVYRVEEVSGSVVTDFTGGAEQALCGPLDVCGASGTVRLSPSVSSGRATLAAYGPARRVNGRSLRAALGLRPGPRLPIITASGVADWNRDSGSASETFTAAGTTCSDTVQLAGGFISFWVGPRRVFAAYGRGSGSFADPLRTRCPGPAIADAAEGHPLATGNVPRTAFRKRRVTITLSRGRPFEAAPYAGATRASLKVVLRRTRVTERLGFETLGGLG
jgi:hypothetical protein